MDNYENPVAGKTYISPRLKAFGKGDKQVRIASKVIESPDAYAFGTIKDEQIIRRKEGASTHIKATFYEDDRQVTVLTIQGYTTATDKPHNASFSFIGDEINTLLEFVANIRTVAFKGRHGSNISDEELRRLVLDERQLQGLVAGNEDLFVQVLQSAITKTDVVAVGYRKRQLETFRRLLEEPEFFDAVKIRRSIASDEAVWQRFFERNPWIFGYGLNYVYVETLDDRKLEQVVQGARIGEHGKRVDGLMKSKGIISNLCFVEIKKHDTPLLAAREYRRGCWPQSSELAGAITQLQVTVAAAMDSIRGTLRLDDEEGYPTGEEAFNFAPKSYLVIGSLAQFLGEHGVSKDKLRSFELLRRSLHAPEIITFDELYERAKFIVSQNDDAPART